MKLWQGLVPRVLYNWLGVLPSPGMCTAGLALTLWALRGFTRCADRLQAVEAEP